MLKKELRPYLFIIILLLISIGCSSLHGPGTQIPSSKLPPTQRPYKLNGIWYYPYPFCEKGISKKE